MNLLVTIFILLFCWFNLTIAADIECSKLSETNTCLLENLSISKETQIINNEDKAQKLILKNCKIDFIPELQEITEISLQHSTVVHGNSLENFTAIKKLEILESNIKFEQISNLKSLEFLKIQNQPGILDEIKFNNFESLTRLELSSNKIREIDEDIFDDLKNLEEINFSKNDLTLLPAKLFKNNKNLKTINFSYNRIQEVDEALFEDLKELETLDLTKNFLRLLPEDLFKSNLNLKKVLLRNNTLQRLSPSLFEPVNSSLVELDLKHNTCFKNHYNLTLGNKDLINDIEACEDNHQFGIYMLILMAVGTILLDILVIALAIWFIAKENRANVQEKPELETGCELHVCDCGKAGIDCGKVDNFFDHMYDGYIDEDDVVPEYIEDKNNRENEV